MKKMMMMALAFSMAIFVNAQKVNVPEAARTALKSKYPQATKVTWEEEKGNYEANWGGKSGEDHSVLFSPAGAFIQIADAIPAAQLPSAAIAYLKQHYGKAKISEAAKITDASGRITYEAEINHKELLFDSNGQKSERPL